MLSSWGHTGRMIRSDKYFYLIIRPENIIQLVTATLQSQAFLLNIGQTRKNIYYLS